jgi:hypothetical protein
VAFVLAIGEKYTMELPHSFVHVSDLLVEATSYAPNVEGHANATAGAGERPHLDQVLE